MRIALLLLPVASLLCAASHAQYPQLLTRVADVPAAAVRWDRQLKSIDATIVRSEFVRVDAAALLRQAGPKFGTLGLRLFGEQHVVEFERTKIVRGHHVLHGKVRGRGGEVVLVVTPQAFTHGTIHLVEDSYVLTYANDEDVHILQEIDDTRRPAPAPPIAVRTEDEGSRYTGSPASGKTLLDVAMFHTPRAKTAAGTLSVETRCIHAIELANATNDASGVDVEFRLVYVGETKYTEDGTGKDLARFRNPTDGYMDEVHKLRDTFGADMMHLITQPAKLSYCGVAYLMTNVSSGFSNWCFAVTVLTCMNGNVVAHELGHNLGCHHDRDNAGGAAYPHAYGFRTADKKFRTVMAYSPGRRVNVWSSPKVKYTTYVMGKTNSEDNALTIEKTKATTAAYRAQKAVIFCETIGNIAGKFGQVPKISGRGTINSTYPPIITIELQWYFANGVLVMGANEINVPYVGGVLVPAPHAFLPLPARPRPHWLDANGLGKLGKGATLWVQAFFADADAVQGVSATNGLKIIVP